MCTLRLYFTGLKCTLSAMAGNAGPMNSRVASVTPPLKGSFPLDHDHTCHMDTLRYLQCINRERGRNGECRELAKQYFRCRMETGLMEKEPLERLGFLDGEPKKDAAGAPTTAAVGDDANKR